MGIDTGADRTMKLEIKLAILSTVIVLSLTAVSRIVLNSWLFYSLFPGLVVGLYITGVHGGTHFQYVLGTMAY
jgi:hypothetical protein